MALVCWTVAVMAVVTSVGASPYKRLQPAANRYYAHLPGLLDKRVHDGIHHYTIYRVGQKKTAPNFSCNNFGKYGPILIMFSLLHSQMN